MSVLNQFNYLCNLTRWRRNQWRCIIAKQAEGRRWEIPAQTWKKKEVFCLCIMFFSTTILHCLKKKETFFPLNLKYTQCVILSSYRSIGSFSFPMCTIAVTISRTSSRNWIKSNKKREHILCIYRSIHNSHQSTGCDMTPHLLHYATGQLFSYNYIRYYYFRPLPPHRPPRLHFSALCMYWSRQALPPPPPNGACTPIHCGVLPQFGWLSFISGPVRACCTISAISSYCDPNIVPQGSFPELSQSRSDWRCCCEMILSQEWTQKYVAENEPQTIIVHTPVCLFDITAKLVFVFAYLIQRLAALGNSRGKKLFANPSSKKYISQCCFNNDATLQRLQSSG